jgi:hypothetical protein
MTHEDETRQLEAVRRDLLREYGDVAPEVVDERFAAVVQAYEQAPIRSFVPVLARRRLREELSQAR